MRLSNESVILDPWNGSGTTTLAATQLGYQALGQDLNPAMVLVAKAALLPRTEASSLMPIALSIIEKCKSNCGVEINDDPLTAWLSPQSATFIRSIEENINKMLLSHYSYEPLTSKKSLDKASSLCAIFYVSLFRAVRRLLAGFIPTNPTWVKSPSTPQQRLRPSEKTVVDAFLAEISTLSSRLSIESIYTKKMDSSAITLGNAESLSLPEQSVNAVISSPPYCTRIDYAVATSIELALLRLTKKEFDSIRRSLMGASTVHPYYLPTSKKWGATCMDFLERVHDHPSKASSTYYYKSHLQYFNSLKNSVDEIAKVLCREGSCILVVQDSYYKDVHNDVARITTEMAEDAGFHLELQKDFQTGRSMVGLNKKAKTYLTKRTTTESVLCFIKK